MEDFGAFLRWEGSTPDTIDVKRAYIKIAGDPVAGLMLSQIIYWHLPKNGKSKLRVKKTNALWLVKADKDWDAEIGISQDQATRARRKLKEKGLIKTETHRFNNVPTTHIRLNESVFLAALQVELGKGKEARVIREPKPETKRVVAVIEMSRARWARLSDDEKRSFCLEWAEIAHAGSSKHSKEQAARGLYYSGGNVRAYKKREKENLRRDQIETKRKDDEKYQKALKQGYPLPEYIKLRD